jgi:hypothetical protein
MNLFTLSTAEIEAAIQLFVLWLREDTARTLKAATIEQYLTHINFELKTLGYPNLTPAIHCPLVNQMIRGYQLEDEGAIPLRERQRIPYPASFLPVTDHVIKQYYGQPEDIAIYMALRAVFRLALGMALRTHEYVHESTNKPGAHEARASNCFFIFSPHGTPYGISDPARYPRTLDIPTKPATPHELLIFFDHRKNSKSGALGCTLTLAASPPQAHGANLLQPIFDVLYMYPPPCTGYIFDGIHPTITGNMLRGILKVVAIRLHLDPTRLVPHSARIGAKLQLTAAGTSETDALTISGHSSTRTEQPYFRANPATAHRTIAALQDPNAATVEDIMFLFS